MTRILLVDDQVKLLKIIKAYLENEGYLVETAQDGREALDLIKEFNPQLLVLDLMLPEISGIEVCQKIRQSSDLPILMLTAKSAEDDKLQGFEYGADDYLVKPFSLHELLARIKAILRRSNYTAAKAELMTYQQGRMIIYPGQMKVEVEGEDVLLTRTEFDILLTLARNPGQVLSRDQLAEKVMGLEFKGFDRTIDAHIKNIRKKIGLKRNQLIYTIYGAGYKFAGE
ncbi:MAG: response regulator transcription factor [Halanaerobiales bacterium]|nr:response regulator transcription factor [Halanaerobiales bacterium]